MELLLKNEEAKKLSGSVKLFYLFVSSAAQQFYFIIYLP
jgi:hypothetical protein